MNVLVFSCSRHKYRHFSPGQNTRLTALASVAEAIWCFSGRAWFRNSCYCNSKSRSRQVMAANGIPSTAFPHYLLLILNIQAKYGLQSQSRPQICWITLIQLESIVGPLKISIDSWPLSQSFHVMIETSLSFWRFLAALWGSLRRGSPAMAQDGSVIPISTSQSTLGPSSYD